MKRSASKDIDISESTNEELRNIRKALRKRELWSVELDKLRLKIPDNMLKEFGKIVDFKPAIHVASFILMIVMTHAPEYIERRGIIHKNSLPDGCLRIDIEVNTADGTKHGYYGKYSMKYSDMIKIQFSKLIGNTYHDILTMSKLDYSIRTDDTSGEWHVTEVAPPFTSDMIEFWKTIFNNIGF